MGSNIIELAKLGHERAAELKASCGAVDVRSVAQLISDLATQLEVQLARGNAQAVQLTNAESNCRELAAENAGLKNALEWLYETVSSERVSIPDEKYSSVTNAAQVLSETPATDAAGAFAPPSSGWAKIVICPKLSTGSSAVPASVQPFAFRQDCAYTGVTQGGRG
ncbi:hypothetical protein JHS31_002567 [Salmonella enterica]|nr:hypothetical protein [Salmonella enterica]